MKDGSEERLPTELVADRDLLLVKLRARGAEWRSVVVPFTRGSIKFGRRSLPVCLYRRSSFSGGLC